VRGRCASSSALTHTLRLVWHAELCSSYRYESAATLACVTGTATNSYACQYLNDNFARCAAGAGLFLGAPCL